MILQIRRSVISLCNQNPCLHHLQQPVSISESFVFSSTSETKKSEPSISTSDYLINRHHFSPETALRVSSYRSHLKDPENADSIISFLKGVGFMRTCIESALRRAACLLFFCVGTIRPKIKLFQDADFCPSDIVKILSSDLGNLTRSAANRLSPALAARKSVVGSSAVSPLWMAPKDRP